MKMFMFITVFFSMLISSGCATNNGQFNKNRRALVIGNSSYTFAPLKNPVNDARDISEALTKLGFEVTTLYDLGKSQLEEAVNKFYHDQAGENAQSLFYYAGHAVQSNGKNYLIAVGEEFTDQTRLEDIGFDLGVLINQMKLSGAELNLVILDACRNNPFTEEKFASNSRSLPSAMRSLKRSKGLAQVKAPSSTLIAFSTSPGNVALDGSKENGLYTSHLLRHMSTPALPIETLFKKVRAGVIKETSGEQIPWEHSSLYKYDFMLAPPDTSPRIRSGW